MGLPPPPRGGCRGVSKCDCQDSFGLCQKVIDTSVCQPAPPPASLFELLEQMGTERLKIKGQDAQLVPHMPGPMYCDARGKLCCKHGFSHASLRNARSTYRA